MQKLLEITFDEQTNKFASNIYFTYNDEYAKDVLMLMSYTKNCILDNFVKAHLTKNKGD